MQVSQQILYLLVREDIPKATHFAAAQPDDFADPFIVRGQSAFRKKRLFENPFEAGPLFIAGGVRLMATVTIIIVKTTASRLLRA